MPKPDHEPIKFYMPKSDEGELLAIGYGHANPSPPKPKQIRAGRPYELIPWSAALMKAVDEITRTDGGALIVFRIDNLPRITRDS